MRLIRGGWIVPVSAPPFPKGGILIQGGRIVRLLREEELAAAQGLEPLDGSQHILLPGLVDAHAHLELSAMAGRPPSPPFTRWVRELVETVRGWQEEDFRISIRQGICQLLRSGITTVGDVSRTGLSSSFLSEAGLRGVVYHEVLGFAPALAAERMAALKEKIDPCLSQRVLVHPGVSPHSPFTLSPRLLRESCDYAHQHRLPLAIHLGETAEEVAFLQGRGREIPELLAALGAWDESWSPPLTTPVGYLERLGVLEGIAGIHLNHVTEADLAILQTRQVQVVYCPKSNTWFGRKGIYPLRAFLERGIPVALGTDSLASNDTLNLFQEMRMAKRLFPLLSDALLLEMATVNGARALGLGEIVGDLAPGKMADLIAVAAPPNLEDPVSYLLSQAEQAEWVMVGGNLVAP